MKNILALTDFSGHANHAIDYACTLANKFDAHQFIVLNTYEIIPLYDSGEGGSLALTMQQTDELETQRKEEFTRLLERITPKLNSNIKVATHLSNSNLIEAVNDICLRKKIDLVVMGIKVKDELEQVLLGSHAHRAIEKINYPVMIVPMNAPLSAPEKIILVTNFYEARNKSAFKHLQEYLHKFKSPLLVVHKIRNEENRAETEKLAAELKENLKEFSPEVSLIDSTDDLGTNVNQIAKQQNASLVISLHKKRGFFSRLFHKSTTKYLAWHSRVPVLVLHFE